MARRRRKVRRRRSKQSGNQLELPFPLPALDAYAAAVIQWKAARLAKVAPFTGADIDDIAQELALDLMVRTPRYDPRRGTWPGFFGQITDNRMANLVQSARAKGRGWLCPKLSLNELVPVAEEGYVERQEMSDVEGHAELAYDAFRTADLRLDLEAALDTMPARLKDVCLRLQSESLYQIANSTGRSVFQVRRDIVRIRELLTAAGLTDYLRHHSQPMEIHDE